MTLERQRVGEMPATQQGRMSEMDKSRNVTPLVRTEGKPASKAKRFIEQAPREDWYNPRTIDEAVAIAKAFVKTPFAGRDGMTTESAFILIARCAELGLSAVQGLCSIHIIKGKPVLSADLMVGLVKSKACCAWFMVVESTNEEAVYETLRVGEPKPTRMVFTIKDAKRAGLLGNPNWSKYPAAMLRARASSALARAVFPDVVGGLYDPDELGGSVVSAGTFADASPSPTPRPSLPHGSEPVNNAAPAARALTAHEVMREWKVEEHLSNLPGLGKARAQKLHEHGIHTYQELRTHLECGHRASGCGIPEKTLLNCLNVIRALQGEYTSLKSLPAPPPEPQSVHEATSAGVYADEHLDNEPAPNGYTDGLTGEEVAE